MLATPTVFLRHGWSVFLAAAAGFLIIAWEVIQIVVAQHCSSIVVVIGLVMPPVRTMHGRVTNMSACWVVPQLAAHPLAPWQTDQTEANYPVRQ